MSAYTRRKAKAKYRDRMRLEKAFQEQLNGTTVSRKKTPYERVKLCRQRKKMNAAKRINDGASTSAAGIHEIMQEDYIETSSTLLESLKMEYTNIQDTVGGMDQVIPVKEEFTPHIEENLELKTETEEIAETNTENIGETELHIKDELILDIEPDDSQSSTDNTGIKTELETESILPTTLDYDEVKIEAEPNNMSNSYDYPNYDDSMDSNELGALSRVEVCLGNDVNIKEEDTYENNQKDFPTVIKEESELTVTETHLISNKFINTTSTITSTLGGIIESQTTKTLIMEIHPMTRDNQSMKMGNPEEILPTTDESYEDMECESFQLNSITGNILSLEQEAYGLLKTKRQKKSPVKEIICPKCSKVFTARFTLNRHLKVHASIEARANGVIKGLKTKLEKRKGIDEEIPIKGLNTKLKKKKGVKDEVEIISFKAKLKKKKGVKDEVEIRSFKAKLDKKKGIKEEIETKMVVKEENFSVKQEEKDGYKCTCGKSFQRRSRMETCLRSHTDYSDSSSYACLTCDKKFKSKDLLTFHRQRQHRKKFPCKFCPTDYHTQKELFKHLQIHQKVQLTEYKVISKAAKGKQELQCLLCAKTYTELSDFKSHIMEDHTEPYKCPHCVETFPKIADFAIHIKKTHPDIGDQSVLDVLEAFSKLVRAWKCETCSKQFHEADKLALHQVEEHTPDMKNEQHFQCRDCQRVFISKCGLNSHMRMHHRTESTEEPEPEEVGVLCLECRKVCADMNALTSHMRLHSMDRKYPCKFCDFRFATPQKRKKHSEIHTGDMKYVCFICEYTCSSENRLKQHKMSVKHANMREYLLTGKPFIEEEQSTSKKQDIKDMVRKKEWGVKKKKKRDEDIACDICGERFNSEDVMQEHKQTHPFIEFPNDDKPSRIFFK